MKIEIKEEKQMYYAITESDNGDKNYILREDLKIIFEDLYCIAQNNYE